QHEVISTEMSQTQLEHRVKSISIHTNYAYVATLGENAGLYILDIENPQNFEIVGFLQMDGELYYEGLWDVKVSNGYAYVTADCQYEYSGTLSKIDICDAENPELLWTITTYPRSEYIKVFDNHAYLTSAYYGFHIFDIDTQEEVGYYEYYPYWYSDVAISGNLAFVTEVTKGLHIYDISLAMNNVSPDQNILQDRTIKIEPLYPNPFNSQVIIPLEINQNGIVTFTVSNILGQCLVNTTRAYKAGSHNFVFDADQQDLRLSNGAYFFNIQYNGNEEIKSAYHIK
ncbi:MAG: T9SS type A sorting domain-containing protein, partial [Candidatus Electryonea clarkiae]|nr:T9SS type A sorting domain-containing protein [Candidatus Electryonea clarkiae]